MIRFVACYLHVLRTKALGVYTVYENTARNMTRYALDSLLLCARVRLCLFRLELAQHACHRLFALAYELRHARKRL